MSRRWLASNFLILGFCCALSTASASSIPVSRNRETPRISRPGLIDLILFRLAPFLGKDGDDGEDARCDQTRRGGPACPTPPPPPPIIPPEI
jgi:hypothetical protein